MLDTNNTVIFDAKSLNNELVKKLLLDVFDALKERGYNPIVQIVGYLVSGDLGYISNHREARKKIQQLDREQILEVLVTDFLKSNQ